MLLRRRLDELVVLVDTSVAGEQEELQADEDDPAVVDGHHFPQEAHGAVVAVGVAGTEQAAAVAHPLLVRGAHAHFEGIVAADFEGLVKLVQSGVQISSMRRRCRAGPGSFHMAT